MEWVQAVAAATGAARIDLNDEWETASGITSADLQSAARAELDGTPLPDIDVRGRAARAGVVGDDNVKAYIERVADAGYYGQWGFDSRGFVDSDKLLRTTAPFVDLATT
jgi:hypothetical protein